MPSPVGDYAICARARVLTTESALPVWEYLITFTNEIDIFWGKPVTATSLLFVVTRWTMVANALLQFAPTTEATFDSIPFPHVPDTDIFLSNCNALSWAALVLDLAGFIETACKQTINFAAISHLCVLSTAKYFPPYEYSLYGNGAIYGPS